jgi:hypothetical protein
VGFFLLNLQTACVSWPPLLNLEEWLVRPKTTQSCAANRAPADRTSQRACALHPSFNGQEVDLEAFEGGVEDLDGCFDQMGCRNSPDPQILITLF